MDKDDADAALPWGDIVLTSPSSSLPTAAKKKNMKNKSLSFGRTNSMGMKVYRRLNIILEEVSDVSRILLPPDESPPSTSVSDLLQKYDVVSLQPMNEPALRNACELIKLSSSPSITNSEAPSYNAHLLDVLVLEYATGSRGGYGLPYKLRKDYVVKALQAGLTFELCYGTAVLDPKRRQGFLRTLCDFHSSYGGIQQKHTLLNKSQNAIRK